MKKFDSKEVAAVVAETLGRDFQNIKIIDVNVAQDLDRDGDHILRIEVVFEGMLRGIDAKRVAGAARRLQPALEEIDADLFPLLSFVSKVDYDRGRTKSEAR